MLFVNIECDKWTNEPYAILYTKQFRFPSNKHASSPNKTSFHFHRRCRRLRHDEPRIINSYFVFVFNLRELSLFWNRFNVAQHKCFQVSQSHPKFNETNRINRNVISVESINWTAAITRNSNVNSFHVSFEISVDVCLPYIRWWFDHCPILQYQNGCVCVCVSLTFLFPIISSNVECYHWWQLRLHRERRKWPNAKYQMQWMDNCIDYGQ